MPDLRTLSRGMQIAGASAILLLIVTFLDWQSVDIGGFGSVGQSAWHGFWGVVLGLLTIAFIGWLLARLFAVNLPELPVPWRTITLALGVLILIFAVLKNLIDDYSAWPSYVGIVLAAGVAAGAWLLSQEDEPVVAGSVPDAPEYSPPPATTTAPPADTPPPPPPASTAPEPPAAGGAPPPSTPQAPPTPGSTPPPRPDDNP
jgi:hypothetical protein